MDIATEKQEIAWANLVCDPKTPEFLAQKVAPPTKECPAGSAVSDTIWYFPTNAAGNLSACNRRIDWHEPMGDALLTEPRFAALLHTAKLYAVLLMSQPRTRLRRLSAIKNHLSIFFDLCDHIADGPLRDGRPRIADLDAEDLEAFVATVSCLWETDSRRFRVLLDVMLDIDHYYRLGLLDDGFLAVSIAEVTEIICTAAGWATPAPAKGEPGPTFTRPPLSDEYCCRMLDISQFYNEHLADAIVRNAAILREMRRVEREEHGLRPEDDYNDPRRARLLFAKSNSKADWPTVRLPFNHDYTWPPKTTRDVEQAIKMLQAGNLQQCALFLGFRRGEELSMDTDCLSAVEVAGTPVDFVRTIRFKHAVEAGGDPLELRAPATVVKAIEIQKRLAKALGSDGIWCCVKLEKLGDRLVNSDLWQIRAFAREHGLEQVINEKPFRPDDAEGHSKQHTLSLQRFRPTMARLIMTGGKGHARLVKRALGHRRIQTSLGYIRQSPWIQEEIAYARRARLKGPPQEQPGPFPPVIHDLDEELDAVAFTGLLKHFADVEGERLLLLAPGVIGAGNVENTLGEFGAPDVLAAALGFAVSNLTKREVLASPDLRSWFTDEAVRIARNPRVRPLFAPANSRENAAYILILREVGIS
jgi:hypothetical protein